MKCPECHAENPDTTHFCGDCGTRLRASGNNAAPPTKTMQTPIKGFAAGSTIAGKYEILEELGKGGMGVVYKAKDTKLKRIVALKFLAPELTRHTEAKERFIHEAQAASSLDHPNICTVHEIDETEGQMFIAMACVEGQSLREKIQKGPMKLDEALDSVIQATSGLHEAHENGIIHRDIKSANIMVTNKGQAKIMDFGVAKFAEGTRFTQTGTTMGTIAYMSPEQAQGEKVDCRTDIWSMGVVLYEIITGRLPFRGDFEQAVVYSILNEEPEPITGLRTGVPMELERIVNKSLAKNPDERYQHADDLLVDLRTLRNKLPDLVSSSAISRPIPTVTKPRKIQKSLLWKVAAASIAITALIVLWNILQTRQPVQKPVSRFAINLPPGETLTGPGSSIALSRDGKNVVYVGRSGNTAKLYLRPIDEFESKPIAGTEGATAPFFSPDGKWVGFFTEDKLKKVSLLGGAPLDICNLESGFEIFSACWEEDGTIIFPDPVTLGLRRISAVGGKPEGFISPMKNAEGIYEGSYSHPQILPGGKAVLVSVTQTRVERGRIGVYSLETGEYISLLDGSNPCYIPTGHLIYALAGNILSVPFDLKKLEISGTPIPVVEDVLMELNGTAHFGLSENGDFVYVPGKREVPKWGIVWVDRTGEITPLSPSLAEAHGQRISPDGKRLVFKKGKNLWLYELERDTVLRFTDDESGNWWPLWTPDSKRIIFNAIRDGSWDLFWKSAEGGPIELLAKTDYAPQPQSWSPDGKELIFTQGPHPENGIDIWILPFDGDRIPRPLIKTRYNEFHPAFSPDGRWLAYASDETGRWEIYARPYPSLDTVTRISTDGGCEPLWAQDGGEIFYRDETGNKMMAVPITTEPALQAGKPEQLFEGNYFLCSYWGRVYDISLDGQQFLMVSETEQELDPRHYYVVLNWFEDLKQIVASD